MRLNEREVGGAEAVVGRLRLVPVRVEQRRQADLVEPRSLLRGQLDVGCAKIVHNLGFRAPADDRRSDAGTAEQPSERDLCWRDLVRLGDGDKLVDNVPKLVLIGDRRLLPARREARVAGCGTVATGLPESRPPASGTPTRMPSFWSSEIGISSYSASRA